MRFGRKNLFAAAVLALLGAQSAPAVVITWTGATSTNFNTNTNYTGNTAPTGNTVLFGTNAATVPNQPTTFTSISLLQLGFQGAGWTIGTVSGAGQTLTLSGNPATLPGIGTGLYVLASTGTGTNEIAPNVVLSQTSNGAPVFVDSGNTLRLDGTLSTASTFALTGTGTLTVLGAFTNAGTFTSNTGATLNAGGYTGATTATTPVPTAITLGSFVSPNTAGTITSTFNVTAGTFSAGALNIGTGTLNIGSGVTTFASGAINIYSGGTVSLANSGANDIGAAVLTSVFSGGKLVFDNSVNNVSRVNTPTTAPAAGTPGSNAITLNGGELSLIGNAAGTYAQNASLVFSSTSAATLTLTPTSGQLTSLTNTNPTNNLTASSTVGGTLLIRGTNLGQAAGQTAGEAQVFLTTTPTLVGGLLPYAIGDNSTTGQGSTFLTYNTTTGFTPVASTASTIAAAAAGTNVLQTTNDATQTATKTINSLLVNGGGTGLTTTLTAGTTLTLASGDYMATASTDGNVLTGGTLAGSGRLYLFVQDGAAATDLTVNSTLNTANNITKSGAGTMLLNTAVSNTGAIDVAQGTLMLGGPNLLGATNNLGNTIYVGSGATFDLNGNSLNIVTANTLGKANNQNNQAGQITNSSTTQSILTFTAANATAERYTGNLGITVNSGAVVFQTSTAPNSTGIVNTYTGDTVLNGGSLQATDATLGAFTNTLRLAGGLFDVATNTTFSASRNISVSAGTTTNTIQADGNSTAGFTVGFNGVVASAGTGSTLILQAGVGANSGIANTVSFFNTGGNSLADNLNITLNVAATTSAAFNPLNVLFASGETIGSLATGGGTLASNTTIGLANATGTLTVGGNNTTTTYAGVIRNAGSATLPLGTTALAKTGTGNMTLSGANSFSGGTTISAGQITLTGSSAAASSLTGTTTAASNVITTTSTTGLVFGQPVTGTGIPVGAYVTSVTNGTTFTISVNATAAGSPTLAVGAYSGLGTGAIAVNGGILSVGTLDALSSNTSTLTVAGGALTSSVAGTTLGGSVTMSSGSISPNGTNVGMLTLASTRTFTMGGGTVNLNLGTAFDQIMSSGSASFNITGGTFALDTTGAGFSYANTYNVLSGFTGTNTVSGLAFTGYDTANYTASLSTAGNLSFTMVAVPEPSTWVAGAGLCLMLAGRYLRRRRA